LIEIIVRSPFPETGMADLQRDVATEFRIAGAIDLAHSAGPEQIDDFMRTQAGAAVSGIVDGG
jgi:hypothetical protein